MRGLGGWMKLGKGIRKVQTYSYKINVMGMKVQCVGHTVNGTMITLYGDHTLMW